MAEASKKEPKSDGKKSIGRRIWRFTWKSTMWFFIITISWVILYRWIDPPTTLLQISERWSADDKTPFRYDWVDKEDISINMKLAVVSSEDNNFMKHNGFDWGAIEKAKKYNATHKKQRGASTISMQVAKNVFLWPSRTWIRKGFEVYFTFLIELFWSKDRIMEVYLNVIEMGPNKFGVGAAAKDYFNTTPARLSKEQAALIAGCLPNPKKFNPGKPSKYLLKRQAAITRLMRLIGESYFERYADGIPEKELDKEKDSMDDDDEDK
jgi:monofunctional glycosyltransferase